MSKGWKYESGRHSLAARGIRTSGQNVVFIRSLQKEGTVGWDFKNISRKGKAIQPIDDSGNIIGYIHYSNRGKSIELSAIDINPEFNRREVGFALMDEFIYQMPTNINVYYMPAEEDLDIVEDYIQDEDKRNTLDDLAIRIRYEDYGSIHELDRIRDVAEKRHHR